MGPTASSGAGLQLAGRRPPLPIQALLARYPTISHPLAANYSNRRLQQSARRANGTALRDSLLRSYLTSV